MRGALNSWYFMDLFFICLFRLTTLAGSELLVSFLDGGGETNHPSPSGDVPSGGAQWDSTAAPGTALFSSGLSSYPAESHHSVRSQSSSLSSVFLSNPLSLILHLGVESRDQFHLLFSWHFKAKPSFFWKWHTFSHKPFSPSQCYSCDYLSAQSLVFFLAKFCCCDVVCRHRKGDLAVHEVTLTVPVARCHLSWECSQCQSTQVALEVKEDLKFVFYELPGHCETVWYHRNIWGGEDL